MDVIRDRIAALQDAGAGPNEIRDEVRRNIGVKRAALAVREAQVEAGRHRAHAKALEQPEPLEDLGVIENGELVTRKVPSAPPDPERQAEAREMRRRGSLLANLALDLEKDRKALISRHARERREGGP